MSLMKAALSLAQKGFHVFPLVPNTKLPAIENFPNEATRDPAQIKRWWQDPVLEIEQPYNVGVSTSKFGDSEALVVIDVDNKSLKKGDQEILKLEMTGLDFPKTFEQTTPTGGRHLVYRTSVSYSQGANVLAPGLDIRAKGGYIVGAGSLIDDRAYILKDFSVSVVPKWLPAKLNKARTKVEPLLKTVISLDQEKAKARAVRYLENDAPVSVEGEAGDETAYKVACHVKDLGVSKDFCFELLSLHWNERCEPPWGEEILKTKVENAYRYGVDPVGSRSPDADFKEFSGKTGKNYLQEMNEKFALIYVEGGHFILHETVDEKGQSKRVFLPEATFKRKFSPYTVQTGKGRAQTYADIWLDWEGRREYAGVCFAPEREPRHNYYNLWRGFTCKPLSFEEANADQKKGLKMFLDHAKENVCQNDENLFRWLMGYFAHMVQFPFERPLTTLVFKGRKGTGKNALADRVGKLIGRSHYLVAHNSRYLTSNFNGHMDSCLMLVLDEAFWSGDKSSEGQLKGLTTAPEILIERKGKEPYMVDNLMRLVVIGNEDWLVPASADERRYAVFQMGEGRRQDREFFATMRKLLDEKGGCGLLLHYLKTFDLSTVDVNQAPITQALYEQKMQSIDAFDQWWFECLSEGRITFAPYMEKWETKVDKEIIRNAFKNYAKERNIKSWLPTETSIGKKIKHCCPSTVSNQKRREGDKTVNEYRFPELEQARAEWEKYIGHEVNWNE